MPEENTDASLNGDGAQAYQAVVDGEVCGGTVVKIDKEAQHNHLDFLFVKVGHQGIGVGQAMWKAIKSFYPKQTYRKPVHHTSRRETFIYMSINVAFILLNFIIPCIKIRICKKI